jgi:hypothetical protein
MSNEQFAWVIGLLGLAGLGCVVYFVIGPQNRVELWIYFFKIKNNLYTLVMAIPGMLDSMMRSASQATGH